MGRQTRLAVEFACACLCVRVSGSTYTFMSLADSYTPSVSASCRCAATSSSSRARPTEYILHTHKGVRTRPAAPHTSGPGRGVTHLWSVLLDLTSSSSVMLSCDR